VRGKYDKHETALLGGGRQGYEILKFTIAAIGGSA
jgi:hypothetical protein